VTVFASRRGEQRSTLPRLARRVHDGDRPGHDQPGPRHQGCAGLDGGAQRRWVIAFDADQPAMPVPIGSRSSDAPAADR